MWQGRQLAGVVGAGLIVLAAAGSAHAAQPVSEEIELVSGHVASTGAAATANSGTVQVFLDRTDESARGTMKSLVATRMSGSGFRIRLRPTAAVRRAAARNSGYVNLLLQVKTARGEALYPFSRKLRPGGATASAAPDVKIPLLPYVDGQRPEPQVVASQRPERSNCQWVRSKPAYRYTRVGQLHQWDGFRSQFSYATGAAADSEIGTAIQRGGANWSVTGAIHVSKSSNSEKGSIINPNRSRFARYMQTRFSYYYFYLKGSDCTRKMKVLRPGKHIGGSYYKSYDDVARVLDGSCHKAKGQQQLAVAPRSTEYTRGGEAQSVGKGVSVFGASLSTQSGWSKHVGTEWRNATRQLRAICSVYGDPNTAPITYVGGRLRG